MSELVRFSLSRRFLNKTNQMMICFMAILFLFIFFIDVIIEVFTQNESQTKIHLVNLDESFIQNSNFVLDDSAQLKVELKDNQYIIHSESTLSDSEKLQLETLIYPYYQSHLPNEIQVTLNQYRHPHIEYVYQSHENINQKHDSLFFVITAMYFMMLSFSGMLAQEVVAEKTSNILEIIGTSVSLQTHYYSKIIIGWLSVLIQFTLVGTVFFISGFIRNTYDSGVGLITFLKSHQIINFEGDSFLKIIQQFSSNGSSILDLLLSLVFLFIGILLIQLLLVMMTIKVNTIEEAGALQNPFYIGLLFLYYGSLMLNNPYSMNQGWGYGLSFLPIFSMIFMPSRIMLMHVPWVEILLTLIINGGFLIYIIRVGQDIYVNNVLSFSAQKKTENKPSFIVNFVKKNLSRAKSKG